MNPFIQSKMVQTEGNFYLFKVDSTVSSKSLTPLAKVEK